MDITSLLSTLQSSTVHRWRHVAKLTAMLPACFVLVLCGCMLWQCTTCLCLYFSTPTGATVTNTQDFSPSPLSLTFCNKGTELNYSFPELVAVDFRTQAQAEWTTAWTAGGGGSSAMESFITTNSINQLRHCKSLQVSSGPAAELRLRHRYGFTDKTYKLNQMSTYLHCAGLFHAQDLSLQLDVRLFGEEKNFMLELSLETLDSLPSVESHCSQAEVDQCLFTGAFQAANLSAGCISKYLW